MPDPWILIIVSLAGFVLGFVTGVAWHRLLGR